MALRFVLVALIASSTLAVPILEQRQQCSEPKERKAWHDLSQKEKKAYLDAEVCLMKTPATLGLRGTKTVFDELQSLHVILAETGAFLPFHRYFMWAHEEKLRTVCNYTGAQPYWEESLDAGSFSESIIFDDEYGFGGDGTGNRSCIESGPFAFYENSLGPGYDVGEHCIERRISDFSSRGASTSNVNSCLKTTSYANAWNCIEGSPHSSGHGGVGEQMLNPISSPGDPLFYMHHTWLDKVWWDWQKKDSSKRFAEIGGTNTMPRGIAQALFGNRPSDLPKPEVKGDDGSTTTLNHVLEMYGVVEDATIGDVMDPQGMMCYIYIDPST